MLFHEFEFILFVWHLGFLARSFCWRKLLKSCLWQQQQGIQNDAKFITFHEWEVGFLESTEKAVNLKNMTVKVSLMFVWKKDKSFVHFPSNRFRMQSFSCGILSSYKVSKSSEARIMCLEKMFRLQFCDKVISTKCVHYAKKRDKIVKCLLIMF